MHEVDGNDSLCNTIKGQQQWMATDGPRAINGLPDISGPPDCSEVICLILIVQPLIRDRVTGAAAPETVSSSRLAELLMCLREATATLLRKPISPGKFNGFEFEKDF